MISIEIMLDFLKVSFQKSVEFIKLMGTHCLLKSRKQNSWLGVLKDTHLDVTQIMQRDKNLRKSLGRAQSYVAEHPIL